MPGPLSTSSLPELREIPGGHATHATTYSPWADLEGEARPARVRLARSAWAEVGPPPCDAPCRWRQDCAAQKLACSAFLAYVDGHKWQTGQRQPTRRAWLRIFGR